MNWHSTPPPGGPSFNQMLVMLLIVAFIGIGALILFEPRLRLPQSTTPSPIPPSSPNPNTQEIK